MVVSSFRKVSPVRRLQMQCDLLSAAMMHHPVTAPETSKAAAAASEAGEDATMLNGFRLRHVGRGLTNGENEAVSESSVDGGKSPSKVNNVREANQVRKTFSIISLQKINIFLYSSIN